MGCDLEAGNKKIQISKPVSTIDSLSPLLWKAENTSLLLPKGIEDY